LLNGEDVSDEIRQMYISDNVSEVSAIKAVRTAMVAQQQQLGKVKNIVMDGRDIGTTVFPDADLKIFMTASPEVRATRRYAELTANGDRVSIEDVKANLAHRDHIDSTREESPLRQAEDAIVKVEAIDQQVFGLTNEYWLSYYIDKTIYDKKYIFLPESIVDENLIKVPMVDKPGIVIGGSK